MSCVIASISSEDMGHLIKNIMPSDIWIVIFPMTLISFRGIDEFCLLAMQYRISIDCQLFMV